MYNQALYPSEKANEVFSTVSVQSTTNANKSIPEQSGDKADIVTTLRKLTLILRFRTHQIQPGLT